LSCPAIIFGKNIRSGNPPRPLVLVRYHQAREPHKVPQWFCSAVDRRVLGFVLEQPPVYASLVANAILSETVVFRSKTLIDLKRKALL
jgi:hypothetical protein